MIPYSNFLYEHPEFYDVLFPDKISSKFCQRAIQSYLTNPPKSFLDLGCGTGSTMEVLSHSIPHCVGLDIDQWMLGYGRKKRPGLDFREGDMRHFDLRERFEVIGSFGWAFGYLNEAMELESCLKCAAKHALPGGILIFDAGRAQGYLEGGPIEESKMQLDVGEYKAEATSRFELDRVRYLLHRRRSWTFPDGDESEDHCSFRLFDEAGLEDTLRKAGFDVLELSGDPKGTALAPGERSLFCVARRHFR